MPRRPLRIMAKVAVICVLGPSATVLFVLAAAASFGAYMDLHGATAAMRVAAVGAVAVVLIPAACWFCTWRFDRIAAKKHAVRLARLDASRHGAHQPRGTR